MISHQIAIDVGTTIDAPVGGVLITLSTLRLEDKDVASGLTYPPSASVAMAEAGRTPERGELKLGNAMRFDSQSGVRLELRFMRAENDRVAHFRLTELTP